MQNWNPIGWVLLIGGFLFGVFVEWAGVGDRFWLVSYTTMLAGLTVLVTNLIRAGWRLIKGGNALHALSVGCVSDHWLGKVLSRTCRAKTR